MAVKTIHLFSGDSYTAPEGGFVGRLHGEIVVDNSCYPPYVEIRDPLNVETYILKNDVDYLVKTNGSTQYLCYPGVPIQLEENYKLSIVSTTPVGIATTLAVTCENSFILMGYTDE